MKIYVKKDLNSCLFIMANIEIYYF